MLNAFEGHTITFLTAANGGGAATLIAFAGSAGYSGGNVYPTLIMFLNGVLLVGIAVVVGYFQLRAITRGLSNDHKSFYSSDLTTEELTQNHAKRFGRYSAGEVFAVGSFLCFLAGLVLSFDTFRDYQDFKEAKEISESAKAETAKPEGVTPMVNVTCAAPLTPTLKRPVKN